MNIPNEKSNVHNFVKRFVWDLIQSTYCSESRGASFAPKNVRERTKKRKVVQSIVPGTVHRQGVGVRKRPTRIDPHMLAVPLGATCTSDETQNGC